MYPTFAKSYGSIAQPTTRDLPPLILYPCANDPAPDEIGGLDGADEAARQLQAARYAEFRMLCFIGKDINRWLEQCVEISSADADMAGLTEASFVNLLLFDPPAQVIGKLREWRVDNFQVIFSRALGLSAVYAHPPVASALNSGVLQDLYRYADALFDCRMKLHAGAEIDGRNFRFELYASGEYSRLLETAWEERAG